MMKEYNRQAAVEYARRWALGKNPKYYHFGGIGGDCTNFISQCLLAGGAVMNYNRYGGWFYISSSNRSPSWTSVAFLQEFLLDENSIGPKARVCTLKELERGDLIQLRQNPTHFNHSLIVTKIERGQIYVCAHSNDALDKPLSSYNFFDMLPLHIEGIKTY